ncbi:MAG: hypothetical protein JW891_08090 [Candidatus Lokiarchaeota archaeon]|nr:hypothetical protein [Candidatus Lokiarchaeota archaeon]
MRSDLNYSLIEKIKDIVKILNSFEGKYEKKFNFTELARYFGLNPQETHLAIDLILETQKTMRSTFKNHILEKSVENGIIYLRTESFLDKIPDIITLEKDHAEKLGDLTYAFLEIKRGKGFDLKDTSSKLSAMVQAVKNHHPYFFYKNGNDLIYPSRLGLELGRIILSYKRLNKPVFNLKVDRYEVKVEQ